MQRPATRFVCHRGRVWDGRSWDLRSPMVPDPPGPPSTASIRLGAADPEGEDAIRGRPGSRASSGSSIGTKHSLQGPPSMIAAGQTPSFAGLDDQEACRRVEAARQVEDAFGRLVGQRQRVVAGRLGEPDREVGDDRAGLGGEIARRMPAARTRRRARRSARSRGARRGRRPGRITALNSRQPAIAKAGPSQATGFVQPRRAPTHSDDPIEEEQRRDHEQHVDRARRVQERAPGRRDGEDERRDDEGDHREEEQRSKRDRSALGGRR